MKCWLQFHFLGSCGYTAYAQKLNMDIFHPPVDFVVCSTCCSTLSRCHFSEMRFTFKHLSAVLHFVSATFIFPPVLCILLSLSLSCFHVRPVCLDLSVSDTVTVFRYRHSKDKRQHLLQRKPRWLLDPGCNKRQEYLTINGAQNSICSLLSSVPLSLLHTHACTQQALR